MSLKILIASLGNPMRPFILFAFCNNYCKIRP